MTADLVFHERIGLEGRRISPFSWRIRYALAHKGLTPEVVPTRFADVGRIRAESGQDFVPILRHGARVTHDSFGIAAYLEQAFPDRPALFGGEISLATTRLINHWSDTVLNPVMRRLIAADFIWCIDPADRAHYRRTREAQFGATLEIYCADRPAALIRLADVIAPLSSSLRERKFLSGDRPAYADYLVFSVFQWARIGSPGDVLEGPAACDTLRAWRARMVGLFDNLGDRFAGYPAARSGPDGAAT